MQTGIMITDGANNHSADKWAEATALRIVDIAAHVAGEQRASAVKLQAALIDILVRYHSIVQISEKSMLTADANHCDTAIDIGTHFSVDNVAGELIAAAAGTPWEVDFADPDMRVQLVVLLQSHFATSMDIERRLHNDSKGA